MTKEVTISYKGGSRRVELQDPGKMERMHQFATVPTPFRMTEDTMNWMQETIVKGSDLDMAGVRKFPFTDGTGLISEIFDYWKELGTDEEADAASDSDKGEKKVLDGLELDDQGAVDLEDMA